MATKAATKRLGKEHLMMIKEPPQYCIARPREDNILEWHYIIRGPPDTSFHGGEYWGVLQFPPEYPFKPPGIKMFTPSGRFKPDAKICTSMSDFHPGSWNVAWSVSTIIVGLLSFMVSDEMTTGSVPGTDSERKVLAAQSHGWNIQQKKFKELFPEYSGSACVDLPNMGAKSAASSTSSASPATASKVGMRSLGSSALNSSMMQRHSGSSTSEGSASTASQNIGTQGAGPDGAAQAAAGGGGLFGMSNKVALALAFFAYLFLSRLFAGPAVSSN
ncbi:Ubiquitin-conjugating enzyme E2 6 [Tilletia horrida]|uniref:Ubiquitin-conjugating enzyme E2 6 n=1 Tax=Tilletia horrida TaxID=155126 RepID=A0AAN6GZG9_9BASI|nr:Ubiquitin-conjugating enzyme E2 6 [Tilletia horrida]KAK0556467.1 Ubiquitin-conjugating enzyme E2 6 [Tilletia horrida]KAK0569397.1 Ubiquitin-conjugating enzyme E2 6 [Tilletia horrida]